MRFEHRYYGASRVENTASQTAMSFAPDTLRAPTHFVAELNRHLPFREAISALHDVVVSDLRTLPKDRGTYFAWLKEQEAAMLAEFMTRESDVRGRVAELETELSALRKNKDETMRPFYTARKRYFDYLYEQNRDAWIVLDPVISVHPDRIFFECFSRDESTYANLSCSHNVFDRIGEFACGTTNIDYSAGLYEEFQKIRDYKTTRLTVEPGGFEVRTADDPGFVEQKIDLPDSWVRGFLQVGSAMGLSVGLPAHTFHLHPMDVHNICFLLRRARERVGPRSIRFLLEPGKPVRLLFEPWNRELVCRRSIFPGTQAAEVRLWGRRRLLTLERLIAVTERFTVHLLGNGLPSFWIAEMPDMQYTLGLSGWTANDWSRGGQFDLLAPRSAIAAEDSARVLEALRARWFAGREELTAATGLSAATVTGALTLFAQAGRVIYDLANGVYRLRELTAEPLPLAQLRFANEREEEAARLLANGGLEKALQGMKEIPEAVLEAHGEAGVQESAQERLRETGACTIDGTVADGKRRFAVHLRIDNDERLTDGSCQCDFFIRNRMHRGPCAHMLALRMARSAQMVRMTDDVPPVREAADAVPAFSVEEGRPH